MKNIDSKMMVGTISLYGFNYLPQGLFILESTAYPILTRFFDFIRSRVQISL